MAWKYLPKESGLGLMAWVLVMVVSLVSASYMVVVNTIDFYKVLFLLQTGLVQVFDLVTTKRPPSHLDWSLPQNHWTPYFSLQ